MSVSFYIAALEVYQIYVLFYRTEIKFNFWNRLDFLHKTWQIKISFKAQSSLAAVCSCAVNVQADIVTEIQMNFKHTAGFHGNWALLRNLTIHRRVDAYLLFLGVS